MTAVTLEEAQSCLPDLIAKLAPGEEVVITRNDQAVARLVGERMLLAQSRTPGNCRGMITIVAEDEEHLTDFGEYMP